MILSKRNNRPLLAAWLTTALALSGCALHVDRNPPPPPDFQYVPPTTAAEPFRVEDSPEVTLAAPTERTRNHELMELSFASVTEDGGPANVVQGLYFRSRDPGAKKLVVVMPIWGTSTYPPSKISHGYARRAGGDAHVIWVYGNNPLFPWTELASAPTEEAFVELARGSAERYRGAVVDMRRLIDWAEARPEIDSSRIAFVGFSMSALVTATLMGNEPGIKAAVLMMGAANLADIFASCGDKAGNVRRHAIDTFGWSIAQYQDFFAGLFDPADPVRYAGHYDPEEILMIDAMFDDCMPETARAALWEVTGFPQRITMLYRHRSSFYSLTPLGLNFARRRIYRFLDENL